MAWIKIFVLTIMGALGVIIGDVTLRLFGASTGILGDTTTALYWFCIGSLLMGYHARQIGGGCHE